MLAAQADSNRQVLEAAANSDAPGGSKPVGLRRSRSVRHPIHTAGRLRAREALERGRESSLLRRSKADQGSLYRLGRAAARLRRDPRRRGLRPECSRKRAGKGDLGPAARLLSAGGVMAGWSRSGRSISKSQGQMNCRVTRLGTPHRPASRACQGDRSGLISLPP